MNLLREVKEKVERPFSVKLAETREVIAHHFEEFGDKVAAAFSGGKDSEVVLYLCLQVNPNVPVVFNNTGVEYPETVRFVAELQEQWNLNLIVTHPQKDFWDCATEYGFAEGKRKLKGKGATHCCYWLKDKPMLGAIKTNNWLGYFTGVTALENYNRMFWAKRLGMCYHAKAENCCKIHPILWWTEGEVWDFIQREGLPINEAYAKGAERVGCMPCTAYRFWKSQMSKVNPKLFKRIMLLKEKQYIMSEVFQEETETLGENSCNFRR